MNQGEENNNIDSEKKYESFLRDGIVVHTMPKNFRRVDSGSSGKHVDAGIFVMIAGLVLLLGLAALSYYLVVQKDFFSLNKKTSPVMLIEQPASIDSEKKGTDSTVATTTSLADATNTEDVLSEATSSIDDLIDEFNQDLGTSSLGASSELSDVSGTGDLSTMGMDLDVASSSDDQVQNEPRKEVVVKEAVDIDDDGLSDLEEALLGTDPNKMDTDGDNYSDFQELDRMYNPAGKGSLADNKTITSYSNPTHQYSLIYPASWTPNNFDKDDSIIFKIDSLQFVQITVQPNTEKQAIEEWYKKQFNVETVDELQKVSDKKDWSGVVSKDGLNYYLMKGDLGDIYIISYNLGISNTLNYQKLFEMMVNSLDIMD